MTKIEKWDPDDQTFWETEGKPVAYRNLVISIPNLLCGFSVWLMWGMIAKVIRRVHQGNPELFNFTFGNDGQPYGDDISGYAALLLTLPAVAGLVGATLRIPNSFMIAICGGRNVKFMTTILLILPALGAGIALQNPDVPFSTLIILAAMSGVGGGAFASSMSNISFFFPKKVQGLALGLNAGLGNAGVSVMQFLIPWIITFGAFGALGGEAQVFAEKGVEKELWVQNAGLVWVPIMAFLAILAFALMNNLPQHKCGPTPAAIGKYLWLTLLGFGGGAVGVMLLISDWGAFPQLLKIFITLIVSVSVTLALKQICGPAPAAIGKYLWLTLLGFGGGAVGVLLWISDWGGCPELLKIFVTLIVCVLVTLALMRYLTPTDTRNNLQSQFAIFNNKHNWVMTWLYVMTFGSFIGYANAFPVLIDVVFGQVAVDANGVELAKPIANDNAPVTAYFIWIGAGVGALIRPVGGWLSDKLGGARVTQWDTWIMVAATILAGYFVYKARLSPTPETYFIPFLVTFIVLFATTGIGNGSTFRMIPIIFSKEQAGPVLGWTSAIAAYGAYLIPKIFATQIEARTPEYALYGFAGYYVTCLAVNWWFYARKNAEIHC